MNGIAGLLLCAALGSFGIASPRPPVPQGIDLRVEHGTWSDPGPLGYYSYYVFNDSTEAASNVRLTCDLPAGSLFRTATVDDPSARCETPPTGYRGHVEIRLATFAPNGFLKVFIYLDYDGEPGADASLRLDAVSDALDPNPDNNGYTYENYVSYPPAAPVLTGVTSRHDQQLGFVVTIAAENFWSPYYSVGIGCMCEPWDRSVAQGHTIVLLGGKELRKKFPKGVPVQLCVTYPDSPTSYITYTRR